MVTNEETKVSTGTGALTIEKLRVALKSLGNSARPTYGPPLQFIEGKIYHGAEVLADIAARLGLAESPTDAERNVWRTEVARFLGDQPSPVSPRYLKVETSWDD